MAFLLLANVTRSQPAFLLFSPQSKQPALSRHLWGKEHRERKQVKRAASASFPTKKRGIFFMAVN